MGVRDAIGNGRLVGSGALDTHRVRAARNRNRVGRIRPTVGINSHYGRGKPGRGCCWAAVCPPCSYLCSASRVWLWCSWESPRRPSGRPRKRTWTARPVRPRERSEWEKPARSVGGHGRQHRHIPTRGDEFSMEEAQGEFKFVSLTVENTGEEATMFDELGVYLAGEDGNRHSSSTTLTEDSLFLEQINLENEVSGTRCVRCSGRNRGRQCRDRGHRVLGKSPGDRGGVMTVHTDRGGSPPAPLWSPPPQDSDRKKESRTRVVSGTGSLFTVSKWRTREDSNPQPSDP